jgi:hypothetical protein
MRSYVIRSFACIAILVGSVPAVLWAQDPDHSATRTRILALEHAWNQAEAFKDLKALDALFDNDLVYVDFDGTLMTKASFLAHVKSAHLEQVVTESMTVQIFNTTAIVSGAYRSNEFANGKRLQRRGRFIDTWVYKDSTWLCIAAEATPILQ